MTRFARMPKKKYLEATTWGKFNDKKQNESHGHTCDDVQDLDQEKDSTVSVERKKKKRAREENVSEEGFLQSKKSKVNGADEESKHRKHHKLATDEQATFRTDTSVIKKQKKNKKTRDDKEVKKPVDANETTQFRKNFSGESRREKKLEKQREARRKRRAKGKTCYHCRQMGHMAADCPQTKKVNAGVGMCYKCGSASHITKNCKINTSQDNPFPFAKCFICGETGHLSSGCPDNPKGLYPRGGGCNVCGSVEHLKRDCPEMAKSKTKGGGSCRGSSGVGLYRCKDNKSADAQLHCDEDTKHSRSFKRKKPKVVKF